MCWSTEKYAKYVLRRYGLKLIGWPEDIVFADLVRVRGGLSTLRRLQWLWDQKILRFVPATDTDLENAAADPRSVLPGASADVDSRLETADVSPATQYATEFSPPAPPPTAKGRVLHPVNLNPVFTFPVDTMPGSQSRRQRTDTKRKRGLEDDDAPSSRRRRGVLSAYHIVEPNGTVPDGTAEFAQTLLVNDRLEAYTPVSDGASGWSSDEDTLEMELSVGS